MENSVILGRFGRTFGVDGWVRVISFTDPLENILSYSPWCVSFGDAFVQVFVVHSHLDKKNIRVKIEGFDSPERAQDLVNKDIFISRNLLPSLEIGQYYWSDLPGLLVKNTQGITLGVLDYLFETPANDVLVVKGEEKEHWIPFIPTVVLRVDLEEKIILVDWDADF